MTQTEIDAFHAELTDGDRAIADLLRREIDAALGADSGRVWHGHPVWFLDDNPIVGYSRLKNAIRLHFWSGASFTSSGLTPFGKFKSAEARYQTAADVDVDALRAWLAEAPNVQWDYKNIYKRKGRLERLV